MSETLHEFRKSVPLAEYELYKQLEEKSRRAFLTIQESEFKKEIEEKYGRKGVDDKINHPSHYNAGKIEVIDAIEDWRLGFSLGNAVKYIARAEHKGCAIEDLKKALWYIEREITRREKADAEDDRERAAVASSDHQAGVRDGGAVGSVPSDPVRQNS